MSRLTINEKTQPPDGPKQRRKRKWEAVNPDGISRPVSLGPDRKRRSLDLNGEQANRVVPEAKEKVDTLIWSPSATICSNSTDGGSTKVKRTSCLEVQQKRSNKRIWEAFNPAHIRSPDSLSPDRKRRRMDVSRETGDKSLVVLPKRTEQELKEETNKNLKRLQTPRKLCSRCQKHQGRRMDEELTDAGHSSTNVEKLEEK